MNTILTSPAYYYFAHALVFVLQLYSHASVFSVQAATYFKLNVAIIIICFGCYN